MANKITKLDNLIRGDTPLLRFPLTVNGAAADLTGYTATFTATPSATPTSGDTPVLKVTAAGTSSGVVEFQLLNNQTNNSTSSLVPGTTYYWDLQLSNQAAGTALRVFTVLRGTFGVDTDYTVSTN